MSQPSRAGTSGKIALTAAIASLLVVSRAPCQEVPDAPISLPAWTVSLGAVVAMSLSRDEQCVAVLTGADFWKGDRLTVLDIDGKTLWDRKLWEINPWIQATSIAVASDCKWAVVGGTSSYRFVWAVSSLGSRWHVATQGTPSGVSISHHEDRVAVTSAADRLYLFDARGAVLADHPVRGLPRNPRFSTDDRHLLVSPVGLLTADGDPEWVKPSISGELTMDLSARIFGASACPGHGPQACDVSLGGIDGAALWQAVLCDGAIAIAADGSYAFAAGGDPQNGCYGDDPGSHSIRVLDSSGALLSRQPIHSRIERALGWALFGATTDCIAFGLGQRGDAPQRVECRDSSFTLRWHLTVPSPHGPIVAGSRRPWFLVAKDQRLSQYVMP